MMINELISHKKEITLKAKATSEVLFFFAVIYSTRRHNRSVFPFQSRSWAVDQQRSLWNDLKIQRYILQLLIYITLTILFISKTVKILPTKNEGLR